MEMEFETLEKIVWSCTGVICLGIVAYHYWDYRRFVKTARQREAAGLPLYSREELKKINNWASKQMITKKEDKA